MDIIYILLQGNAPITYTPPQNEDLLPWVLGLIISLTLAAFSFLVKQNRDLIKKLNGKEDQVIKILESNVTDREEYAKLLTTIYNTLEKHTSTVEKLTESMLTQNSIQQILNDFLLRMYENDCAECPHNPFKSRLPRNKEG